jgi:hypothetical protein
MMFAAAIAERIDAVTRPARGTFVGPITTVPMPPKRMAPLRIRTALSYPSAKAHPRNGEIPWEMMMKTRFIAMAAMSLTLNGIGIVAQPAQAALPFCVKDATIVADSSGYERYSPEWQEVYDQWYDQCSRSQPRGQ